MEYRAAKGNNNKTGRGWKTFKYYDDLDRVLGHCPALRPPFVLDAVSRTYNHEGVRVDRSSDSESSKTDKFIYSLTCSYILVRCTCHFCLQKRTQRKMSLNLQMIEVCYIRTKKKAIYSKW